jgi:hypothetical protein
LLRYDEELLVDGSGQPLAADIRSVETWQEFGWGVFSAAATHALFHRNRRFQPDLNRNQFESKLREFVQARLDRGQRLWRLLRSRDPADERVRTITFASDNVSTPLKGVMSGNQLKREAHFTAGAVAKIAPRLYTRITAPGDGYISTDDVLNTSSGSELVRDRTAVPAGNYVFMAPCKGHRYLLQNDAILANLSNHLAHAPPVPAVTMYHRQLSGVSL